MKKCTGCIIKAQCKLKQNQQLKEAEVNQIREDECFFTPEQILACNSLADLQKLKTLARQMQAVQACATAQETNYTQLYDLFGI